MFKPINSYVNQKLFCQSTGKKTFHCRGLDRKDDPRRRALAFHTDCDGWRPAIWLPGTQVQEEEETVYHLSQNQAWRITWLWAPVHTSTTQKTISSSTWVLQSPCYLNQQVSRYAVKREKKAESNTSDGATWWYEKLKQVNILIGCDRRPSGARGATVCFQFCAVATSQGPRSIHATMPL